MITLGRIAPSREGLTAGTGEPIGGIIPDEELVSATVNGNGGLEGMINGNGDLAGVINGNGDLHGQIEDDES